MKKGIELQTWQTAWWIYQSPLGPILLLGHDDVLTDLYFVEEDAGHLYSRLLAAQKLPVFSATEDWLEAYFSGANTDRLRTPKYQLHGSDFQKLVWGHIESIAYGQSLTYGEIAKKVALQLGRENMSAQAVGGATGSNPISLIVPCHRVLGAHQAITGYGGGLDRKRFLLDLEKIPYKDLMK